MVPKTNRCSLLLASAQVPQILKQFLSIATKPGVELFVLSFASLFFELLVIRWMSGDISAFSVFKTFPLVTCYVGLGVGCALGTDKHFKLFPVALLLTAVLLKVPDLLGVWSGFLFPSDFRDWGGKHGSEQLILVYTMCFLPILILLLSGPFAAMATLGARIGKLFNELTPLKAYAVDIAGAITGSVVFTFLSFQYWAPWQMLVPLSIVLSFYLARQGGKSKWSFAPLALAIGLAFWSPVEFQSNIVYKTNTESQKTEKPKITTIWSRYQRLDVVPQQFVAEVDGKQVMVPLGVEVFANRRSYQWALNLLPDSFKEYNVPVLNEFMTENRRQYRLDFQLQAPKEVLIVGAGSGSDVEEALNCGATHVDAVDLDPAIIKIGKEHNPGRPYQDPRVTVICDDARHYFNHCKKTYDLIVYAHLDSFSALGHGGSVRVDNYVYTLQSFQSAQKLLKPNGLLVLAFVYGQDWLKDRLFSTLKLAVGQTPLLIEDKREGWLWPNTVICVGEAVQKRSITLPESEQKAFSLDYDYKPAEVSILTDDWPYLYVKPHVDWIYLLVLSFVIAISCYAGRKVLFRPAEPREWQLFFMGSAFLLLELQAISRLSLLYGANWLTVAIVINSILMTILLSNLLVIRLQDKLAGKEPILFVLLFASLLISYFTPVQALQVQEGGHILITLLTSLPMFAAGLLFPVSFNATPNPRKGLAFNLLGGVLGAILEYLSTLWGVNSLVLVAVFLYLCSYLFFSRIKRETV
ncbi:MAG: hypothetical protein K2Y39_26065 [Candidatus Obscuribacterales bacterium]|nr:hypothetical protein [Candidatus Obscuribacterales bacterium]